MKAWNRAGIKTDVIPGRVEDANPESRDGLVENVEHVLIDANGDRLLAPSLSFPSGGLPFTRVSLQRPRAGH